MSLAEERLSKYANVFTVDANFDGTVRRYPVYRLMERLLKIIVKKKDGEEGKLKPFLLNGPQIRLYEAMCAQKLSGKPIRIDILKSRQIGFSTFIAGFFFIMTMFTPNFKAAVVADEKGHAKNIFRKYQIFYDHLDDTNPNYAEIRKYELQRKGTHPSSWKPALKYNKGQEYMETASGGSILEVLVAGEGAGRSDTYDAMHFTECAFFENDLGRTLNGATETVPDALDTFVFLETTANGFNEYKDIWDADFAGKGSYLPFFVAWFENEEYRKEFLQGEEKPVMEDWLIEKQKMYNLSDEAMHWYWTKYVAKRRSKEDVLQEYPFCPVDAFVSTGSCIFGGDLVAMRKTQIMANSPVVRMGLWSFFKEWSPDGKSCRVEERGIIDTANGPLIVFEEPKKGHPYVVICDPNDEVNDDTAIQVLDNYSGEQVAEFSTNEMPLDEISYQLYCIGKWYNWALVSVENNTGNAVMDRLIKMHYPHIYIMQETAAYTYKQTTRKRYGHNTSVGNRQFMLDQLKVYFRENPNMVKGYKTLCEMESFQHITHVSSRTGAKRFKDEAAPGKHDDLVMALAAFVIVRGQQTAALSNEALEEETKFDPDFFAWDTSVRRARAEREGQQHEKGSLSELVGVDF